MADRSAQQQQDLFAMLAAQQQFCAPFMYGAGVAAGASGGGNMFWPSSGADYFMWPGAAGMMTGMMPPPPSIAFHNNNSVVTTSTESFEDVLRKMLSVSTTSVASTESIASSSSSSMLPTTTMVNGDSKHHQENQHSNNRPSRKRSRKQVNGNKCHESTPTRSGGTAPIADALEPGEIRRRCSDSSNRQASSSGPVIPSHHLSNDVRLNSELIEASAQAAWSLMLSNPLLLQGLYQQQLSTSVQTTTTNSTTTTDSVSDTINNVIRRRPSTTTTNGNASVRRNSTAITTTKSIAHQSSSKQTKSKCTPVIVDERTNEMPLDLSQKNERASSSGCASDHVELPITSESSSRNGRSNHQQHADDTSLFRVPLTMGWRRQICVRSLSSAGIRGDVFYYAPCGKRLSSYSEVLRYLSKSSASNIGREHFSFSCKVLVGEFQHDNNTSVKLTESEILSAIGQQTNNDGDDVNTNGRSSNRSFVNGTTTKTCGNDEYRRKHIENATTSSSDNNTIRGRNGNSVDHHHTNNADRRMHQIDQQLLQQFQFLQQKTGEQYYTQQMLLAGLAAHNLELNRHEQQKKVDNNQLNAVESINTTTTTNFVAPAITDDIQQQQLVVKMKQNRQPIDDLLLDDPKELIELDRIEGLSLTSKAFADILMVMEFVNNFGHVLKIDKKNIPTLSEVHAGLQNHPVHLKALLTLTKVLVTLVLEYPGLPSGAQGRTFLGQSIKDVGIHRENFSELLRMFLSSRDELGIQLGCKLETSSFEVLDPESKAAILAYLCNELLYCRNIVREIEGNMEEVTRLRGEKWMREGKVRLLRGIHAKKSLDEKRNLKRQNSSDTVDDTRTLLETPDSDLSSSDLIVKPTKQTPPGISQCETITDEEKAMSSDELETLISRLSAEANDLRERTTEIACRVRTQPYGQDRHHRMYWILPILDVALVESVESVAINNPACNIDVVCTDDPQSISLPQGYFVDPDVAGLVDDLVDAVCRRMDDCFNRRLSNRCKRGWWTISDDCMVDRLKQTMHGRGIRERLLQRNLAKYSDHINRTKNRTKFNLDNVNQMLTKNELESADAKRLDKVLDAFEYKVVQANVHCRHYQPISNDIHTGGGINENDDESGDSKSSWTCSERGDNDISQSTMTIYLDSIRSRLLAFEMNIERRYLQPIFHTGLPLSTDRILGRKSTNNIESSTILHAEESTELIGWRSAVRNATSSAQLMLCIQQLDAAIAWDKSIMRASCQICRSGENEGQLLLCDGCDAGFHMYCFRPQILVVPDDEWFCPSCISFAIKKPCCMVCVGQTTPMLMCIRCTNSYHIDCLDSNKPTSTTMNKSWICMACIKREEQKSADDRDDDDNSHDSKPSIIQQPSTVESIVISRTSSTTTIADDNNCPSSSNRKDKKNLTKKAPKRKQKMLPAISTPDNIVTIPSEPPQLMELFNKILCDLEQHKDAEPFKHAVDTKAIPLYKKIIRKPMDLSLVRSKIVANKYESEMEFQSDINQIFENCKIFNEDQSSIGKAGQSLRRYFNRKWKEEQRRNSKQSRLL